MQTRDLTEFIEQVTGDSHLRVENDLGDGFVVLKITEAERRQARHDIRCTEDIIIEMLRNARDAGAKHIFLAVSKEGAIRKLTMLDDGSGIPDQLTKRIFDARVTSKLDSMHIDTWGVHGRGMALYAVRLNAKRAEVVQTKVGGGSSFVIETDTDSLPEKADQSSQPMFLQNENGKVVVRGARNINRTVAEFAYVVRDTCSVYLGSPVEIAASLYDYGMALLPKSTRIFCDNPKAIDICKRLALASVPEELCALGASLGLDFSERSARRILDGEIEPLFPLIVTIKIHSEAGKTKKKKRLSARDIAHAKDERGLKLTNRDAQALKQEVYASFERLAPSYYLDTDVDVSLQVRKDALHISIPLRKQH